MTIFDWYTSFIRLFGISIGTFFFAVQHKQNSANNAFANAFDPVVNIVAEDEGNLDETMVDGNFDAIAAGGTIN